MTRRFQLGDMVCPVTEGKAQPNQARPTSPKGIQITRHNRMKMWLTIRINGVLPKGNVGSPLNPTTMVLFQIQTSLPAHFKFEIPCEVCCDDEFETILTPCPNQASAGPDSRHKTAEADIPRSAPNPRRLSSPRYSVAYDMRHDYQRRRLLLPLDPPNVLHDCDVVSHHTHTLDTTPTHTIALTRATTRTRTQSHPAARSPRPPYTANHDAHPQPHAQRLRWPSLLAGAALVSFSRTTSIFALVPPSPLDARALGRMPPRHLPPPVSAAPAVGVPHRPCRLLRLATHRDPSISVTIDAHRPATPLAPPVRQRAAPPPCAAPAALVSSEIPPSPLDAYQQHHLPHLRQPFPSPAPPSSPLRARRASLAQHRPHRSTTALECIPSTTHKRHLRRPCPIARAAHIASKRAASILGVTPPRRSKLPQTGRAGVPAAARPRLPIARAAVVASARTTTSVLSPTSTTPAAAPPLHTSEPSEKPISPGAAAAPAIAAADAVVPQRDGESMHARSKTPCRPGASNRRPRCPRDSRIRHAL
ncbi:hypothetical protein C8R44DRAFT_883447 [Mycena epipterygia]|nr:hypothetical protein C8R44DRAFT_883447 [Mycena epipterygia]